MNTIEEIIEDFRLGRPVVIVDDENRENEGDLIAAAESVDYATVNLMVSECRGLMCAPLSAARAEALGLRQMEKENNDAFSTAFTVSVDGFGCTTTGISVADRLNTLRWLADPTTVSVGGAAGRRSRAAGTYRGGCRFDPHLRSAAGSGDL